MYANVRRRERIFMLAAFHILLAFLLNSTHSYWGEENLSFFFSLSIALSHAQRKLAMFFHVYSPNKQKFIECVLTAWLALALALSLLHFIFLFSAFVTRAHHHSLSVCSLFS